MIETYEDLRAELKKRGMTTRQFEVRFSVLAGQPVNINTVKAYTNRMGTFSYTQKALFNCIFGLSWNEFVKIGAFDGCEAGSTTNSLG